jgi:DNA polymerase (family 10)
MSLYGSEQAELYNYFVRNSDNSSFPKEYLNRSYSGLLSEVDGKYLYGNFHNHSTFSDGKLSINELRILAKSHGKSFIGISDHTKRVNGIDEDAVIKQHLEIDYLNNSDSSCRILKGVECEILPNGTLDFSRSVLETFDYVIIAAHRDTNMIKSVATNRLIAAIENPAANILAHPSARLYGKNVGLHLDMHKVIDACVANRVVIEINGDTDRLDLDPKYIDYALNRGAIFSLDSDTHSREGYLNINNSISIANDYHIPSSSIINTYLDFDFTHFKNKYA